MHIYLEKILDLYFFTVYLTSESDLSISLSDIASRRMVDMVPLLKSFRGKSK